MTELLGSAIAIMELAVALTIIGANMFGDLELSERAYRLLRWTGNRPESLRPGGERASEGDR